MASDPESREKWRAYPNTVLTFAAPAPLRIDLRQPLDDDQRRALAAAGWSNAFAVLTAENPRGDNTDDEPTGSQAARNERANRERRHTLHETLAARHVRARDVEGSAPDGSYTERCVAIDVPLQGAVELARDFDQLAIFWFDGSRFWLVPAKATERPVPLPGGPAEE